MQDVLTKKISIDELPEKKNNEELIQAILRINESVKRSGASEEEIQTVIDEAFREVRSGQ